MPFRGKRQSEKAPIKRQRPATDTGQRNAAAAPQPARSPQKRFGNQLTQDSFAPKQPVPSSPKALIDEYTNFFGLNLREEALGKRLAKLASDGVPASFVTGVLVALGDRMDQGEVASAMILELDRMEALGPLAQSEAGVDVLTSALGALRKRDRRPADLVTWALFPAPPPFPKHAFPILVQSPDVQVIGYAVGSVRYDLSGYVMGQVAIHSTLSPLDFVGGIAAIGRAGVRALVLQDLTATTGLFTGAALKSALPAMAASGAIGAGFNIIAQCWPGNDLREFELRNVFVEFVVAGLYGAIVGRVMAGVPLKSETVKELMAGGSLREFLSGAKIEPLLDALEVLVRQQGGLAAASLLSNMIRSFALQTGQATAILTSANDALISIPLNFLLQAVMLGRVGDRICGPAMSGPERMKSPGVSLIRTFIALFRQAVVRGLSGLTPGATSK